MTLRRSRLLITLLAAGFAATLALVGSGLFGRVRPDSPLASTPVGTTIGGLPAAGLDRAALTDLLQRVVAQAPQTIQVTAGARSTSLPLKDLGFTLDVPATVDRALGQPGRIGSPGVASGRAVQPVIRTDTGLLDRTVARVAAAAALAPSDGDLQYRAGRVRPTAPHAGQRAEPQTINAALRIFSLHLPARRSVAVDVDPVPAHARRGDLAPVVRRAQALLAQASLLTAGDRRVRIPRSLLGPQLTIVPTGTGSGHGHGLGLRPGTLGAAADALARRLSSPAIEPRVSAPTATPILREQGNATWKPRRVPIRVTTSGTPGQQVRPTDVAHVLAQLVTSATPPTTIAVASSPVPPAVKPQNARRINAILGTFTTPFRCCQPRVRNIALIARTVDGTLIAPGATFTLNGIVGPRTRAKGYVEAPFILNGELATDVGGGVSQFATTSLNAAYFAGLRIDQHKAHSFYISRYPPGREATVNYPSIDLRWTNTSDTPVLVRATAASTSLTVTVYGRDDGRTVTSTTGPRRPIPGRDFRITVSRVTRIPGRAAAEDTMTTTYNKPPKGE